MSPLQRINRILNSMSPLLTYSYYTYVSIINGTMEFYVVITEFYVFIMKGSIEFYVSIINEYIELLMIHKPLMDL